MTNVYQSELNLPLKARGKVRDIYEIPSGILLVASDRLSAFDVVFPDPIPMKGKVLNQLAAYWFEETAGIVANHVITTNSAEIPEVADLPEMAGRCTLCRPAKPLPVECVVRGYLEGSAWGDYQRNGIVSGVALPPGLNRRQKLDAPIFTPSTKAEEGHDEPISFDETINLVGVEIAEKVRAYSIALYEFAHARLLEKGIVLSDTKFEFGVLENGEIILIDEALTPDSSRFWVKETYGPEGNPQSYDKQYVRDYVENIGWDKKPPAPGLPEEVIDGMTQRYVEIYKLITGKELI